MSSFRKFLLKENEPWSYRQIQHGQQPFDTPVGGFQNVPQIAQWWTRGREQTANYPGTNYKYEEVEHAIADLSYRLMRLAEFCEAKKMAIDSGGVPPENVPRAVKDAEFDPANKAIIHGVDVTYFTGQYLGGKNPVLDLALRQFKIIDEDKSGRFPGKYTVYSDNMHKAMQDVQNNLRQFYRRGEKINAAAQGASSLWGKMTQRPGIQRFDHQWWT